MNLRFTLVALVAACISFSSARAEDISYHAHKKYFYLCAYAKECSYCESCTKDVYKVRIKNNTEKRIKSVYYQYYSPLNDRVITNEAQIQGDVLENQAIGNIFVCIKGKTHWAITKIVYTDDTEVSFKVDEPLRTFIQEADECSCNIPATEKRY